MSFTLSTTLPVAGYGRLCRQLVKSLNSTIWTASWPDLSSIGADRTGEDRRCLCTMASSIHFDRMCGFASQGDSVDAEEGASRAQKDRGQVMNAQERKKPRISSHFLPS